MPRGLDFAWRKGTWWDHLSNMLKFVFSRNHPSCWEKHRTIKKETDQLVDLSLTLVKDECWSSTHSESTQLHLWPADKGMENLVPVLSVSLRVTLRRALKCLGPWVLCRSVGVAYSLSPSLRLGGTAFCTLFSPSVPPSEGKLWVQCLFYLSLEYICI